LKLLDLIEEVLEARTGPSVADPKLEPLGVLLDPKITKVSKDRLTEFVGEWKYPPEPLGLPASTEFNITAGEGHLMSYSPTRGTFRLYLQKDGTMHQEDSYALYFPIREHNGSFAGIADAGSIMEAAITAAGGGDGDHAGRLLKVVEGKLEKEATLPVEVIKVVVDLFGGKEDSAERAVQQLSEHFSPVEVEQVINQIGYLLMRRNMEERALEIFEFNTRIFPESWNTWDSLGEAYFNLGHKEEAIKAYKKSLKLNPKNEAAKRMISRIKVDKEK